MEYLGINNSKIYECYTNNIEIEGLHNHPNKTTGYGVYIGGITGINRSENSNYFADYNTLNNVTPETYNCYAIVNIKGVCPVQTDIGAIAGLNQSNDSSNPAYLHNCYGVLQLNEETSSNGLYVGQIVGLLDGTTKLGSNIYISTNNIPNEYQSGPAPTVLPRSSVKCNNLTELNDNILVIGDSFSIDTNNINNGYPILKWQTEE